MPRAKQSSRKRSDDETATRGSARAIWKGVLTAGKQRVPVKLVSAVEDHDIHFHLLDKRTQHRVRQFMIDPDTGREVAGSEVRKGYQVEPGVFVVLRDEELEKIRPEPSRDIELLGFLAAGAIHHQWYERPYYLVPDGDAADYAALAQAMAKEKKEALASWVMRGKHYHGALRSEGDFLVLISMRHADEVLLPRELPSSNAKAASKRELAMAKQLISMLEGPFEPREFQDEYTERLQKFLDQRARGQHPKLARVHTRRETGSLEQELVRSLAAMRKRDAKQAA